jgi:hypothetical protein
MRKQINAILEGLSGISEGGKYIEGIRSVISKYSGDGTYDLIDYGKFMGDGEFYKVRISAPKGRELDAIAKDIEFDLSRNIKGFKTVKIEVTKKSGDIEVYVKLMK